MTEMRDAALSYAARGWRVIPLRENGKEPTTERGVYDATTDSRQIRAWWERRPDANVGIACGEASGLWVLDVDGDEGAASLSLLEGEISDPVAPVGVALTRRGYHYYFYWPEGGLPNAKVEVGLDVQGEGKYVVAPPSVHPEGDVYRWERLGVELELAPRDLVSRIREHQLTRDPNEPLVIAAGVGDQILLREYHAVATAPEGQRNDQLNKSAYTVAPYIQIGELTRQYVEDNLTQAALVVGLEPQETERTIRSGIESALASEIRAVELSAAHDLQAAMADSQALSALGDLRAIDSGAWGAIRNRFQGVEAEDGTDFGALERAVVAQRQAEQGQGHLTDPPTPRNYIHPEGYDVTDAGIRRIVDREGQTVTVAEAPVVLIERLVDDSGTEMLRLAWRRYETWKELTVDRVVMYDAQKVKSLAARGFPISSVSANEFVRYITQAESVNARTLPVTYMSRRLGWYGQDELRFVSPEVGDVSIHTYSEALQEFVEAHHASGELEDWLEVVAPLSEHPRVRLGILAALSPVLLRILEAQPFVVDWAGETSTGKTTTLRVAASVWGSPELIGSWDATPAAIERRAGTLNGAPLLLDETKRARSAEFVSEVVYNVSQGRGKDRATVQGMQETVKWSTVMLSTGEQPLTSFTQDGGTRGRVVSVWGQPFEGYDSELVNRLTHDLAHTYGLAGPAFVRRLQNTDWAALQRRADELRRDTKERVTQPVASRRAEYVAVLRLTEELAVEYGLLDEVDCDDLWTQLTAGHTDDEPDDRPLAALRELYEWCVRNTSQFEGRNQEWWSGSPNRGWSGIWYTGQWTEIAVFQSVVRSVLYHAGHDYESVVRSWRDRGWLEGDGRTANRELGGELVPMLVIRRAAVDEVLRND